jgi:hypothetical protein
MNAWTGMPMVTSSGSTSRRFDTMRVPSSSSTSATMYVPSNHGQGGCRGRTKLYTSPRPEDSIVSHVSELQRGHIGRGGWRRVAHPEQRWISNLPSLSASQKNLVSGVVVGARRSLILAGPPGLA